MNRLFIDLESVPTQREDLRDLWERDIKPPGNISKPETIAAWERDKKPAILADAYEKTALDLNLAEVVVIGYAWDDMPAATFARDYTQGPDQECAILSAFAIELARGRSESQHAPPLQLIGFNHTGYDLPLLRRRYIIHGLPVPYCLRGTADIPPWRAVDENIYDVMVAWGGRGRVSMDTLCRVLGVPGKGDISGADVWPTLQQPGGLERVVEYCKEDVERTRTLYKRLTGIGRVER